MPPSYPQNQFFALTETTGLWALLVCSHPTLLDLHRSPAPSGGKAALTRSEGHVLRGRLPGLCPHTFLIAYRNVGKLFDQNSISLTVNWG